MFGLLKEMLTQVLTQPKAVKLCWDWLMLVTTDLVMTVPREGQTQPGLFGLKELIASVRCLSMWEADKTTVSQPGFIDPQKKILLKRRRTSADFLTAARTRFCHVHQVKGLSGGSWASTCPGCSCAFSSCSTGEGKPRMPLKIIFECGPKQICHAFPPGLRPFSARLDKAQLFFQMQC